MTTRRKFITTGALAGAASLAAPAVTRAQAPIKWRMQTYAGAALGEHVVKPAVEAFNTIAQGQMEIELYYSDQLVPTAELFQAMQRGTIDCVQSDDDSMASPTEVTVFGGYFPLALRYSLDVPALFNKYGLGAIWAEEYAKVGVKHISAGSWDPCNFSTKKPINSLSDLQGLRIFTFPTAGRFLTRFGVVPVTLPWEDVEVALQTGELDGLAWSGITEVYTVGWANVTDYFLTNNISGAWIGHFFANMDRWNEVPPHLQELLRVCFEQSHYYRQHWYWAGEAHLRVNETKLKLTTIPDAEWKQVEDAAVEFWDEIAQESEVKAKVVSIIKDYNETMKKAGPPYRFS
ncbi:MULTISPECIES: TRAP transporter substrate-binding protein [Cereibacter]|uniref:TRAP-type mannitol/chloroaromatic compound transport system substrate-binding protein n=1 Tax=Cereibacter johrii TaxID=445629 RepID=A0ABX5JCZ1_9RHOB|nr:MULTISPECIES: TRAP transporter substrate-binding protein [Cereibacter]EKX56938.1 TRAP-type C4-dicarboxylate transport system, periplasmic component [Rhodobacter sp. AKP1]RDS96214.1 TRAP transporter substrate-binding protein [Cereibacter sphaeroides f. sp. denitrificans]MEA5161546.1 TRAP transporter substrate-binding protein [Cereibacter johrii]ODM42357.1 C4-dicarboxylate ABC transporter [Cereibacter johrii]PTM81700.1 TRAP-type mannitol/chloroaromatic compound transport system substrate-bind